jgi:hypothetical protein
VTDLQVQVELMFHLKDPKVHMVRQWNISAEIWMILWYNDHHEDFIMQVTSLKNLLIASLKEKLRKFQIS